MLARKMRGAAPGTVAVSQSAAAAFQSFARMDGRVRVLPVGSSTSQRQKMWIMASSR